jgi:hypothetical protein
MTKTADAVKRVLAGEKAYAVAKDMGLSPSGLYVALSKERKRAAGYCECCGQKLPEKTIDTP